MKSSSVLLTNVYFPSKRFPPNVYRMLTFVYDDDEDNATADTNTDHDDMYPVIALA